MQKQPDLVDVFYRDLVRPLGNLVILFAQTEAAVLDLTTALLGSDEQAAHALLKKSDAKERLLEEIRRSVLTGFDLDELLEGIESLWEDKEQRNRYFHDEWFPDVLDQGQPMTRGLRKRDGLELFGSPSPSEIWALALRFQQKASLFTSAAYRLRKED
jgi:hypothetical protein